VSVSCGVVRGAAAARRVRGAVERGDRWPGAFQDHERVAYHQPIYLGREGVVTSLLLFAGPLVALWVMAWLLPPWEEGPEASHA